MSTDDDETKECYICRDECEENSTWLCKCRFKRYHIECYFNCFWKKDYCTACGVNISHSRLQFLFNELCKEMNKYANQNKTLMDIKQDFDHVGYPSLDEWDSTIPFHNFIYKVILVAYYIRYPAQKGPVEAKYNNNSKYGYLPSPDFSYQRTDIANKWSIYYKITPHEFTKDERFESVLHDDIELLLKYIDSDYTVTLVIIKQFPNMDKLIEAEKEMDNLNKELFEYCTQQLELKNKQQQQPEEEPVVCNHCTIC